MYQIEMLYPERMGWRTLYPVRDRKFRSKLAAARWLLDAQRTHHVTTLARFRIVEV